MLFGKSPFIHENSKIMFRGILCEHPKYPDNYKNAEAIDFIDKLLQKNPSSRLGFEDEQDVFAHPWYKSIDFSTLMSKKVKNPASNPAIAPRADHPEHRGRVKHRELLRDDHQRK